MLEVERRLSLAAGADEVWDLVGDFGDLGWHPAAKATDLEDRDGIVHRAITLPDDAVLVERLEDMNDSGKTYSYSIVEGPLPVSDYRSTLRVIAVDDGCEVCWGSAFTAAGVGDDAAKDVVAGIYEAGFAALSQKFG